MDILRAIIIIFAFIVFIFLGNQCSGNCGIKLSADEIAIYENSDRYQLPSSLLMGIEWAESMNGKWVWSDSYSTCIKQKWFRNHKNRKQLEKKYGHQIGWCVGKWQVLYMSAYDEGFRGSPTELTNTMTNCKYCSKILRHYVDGYKYVKKAISAYNLGYPGLDHNGDYINQVYVDKVWKIYTNRIPGGYHE